MGHSVLFDSGVVRISPPGAKALIFWGSVTARLKSCPVTKQALSKAFQTTTRLIPIALAVLIFLTSPAIDAQKGTWRQATDAELGSLLPARAPVEKEHIETEMRTASGIVNHGHYIAGVVLITAGYSAEGKYSHYLVVQAPLKIGGIAFKPGEYVFGYTHQGDVLSVHFNVASTGALVGTAEAHRLTGSSRVESLHIWPPGDKPLMQIGRFGLAYELADSE
jgi:hypothetical protein